jgi:hypothetical protein
MKVKNISHGYTQIHTEWKGYKIQDTRYEIIFYYLESYILHHFLPIRVIPCVSVAKFLIQKCYLDVNHVQYREEGYQ